MRQNDAYQQVVCLYSELFFEIERREKNENLSIAYYLMTVMEIIVEDQTNVKRKKTISKIGNWMEMETDNKMEK